MFVFYLFLFNAASSFKHNSHWYSFLMILKSVKRHLRLQESRLENGVLNLVPILFIKLEFSCAPLALAYDSNIVKSAISCSVKDCYSNFEAGEVLAYNKLFHMF